MSKFVVNVRSAERGSYTYVGRHNRRCGFEQSPFANPFRVPTDGHREQVIEKYRKWLLAQPDLVARAKVELCGKLLGCWCWPRSCHADVLAEISNE